MMQSQQPVAWAVMLADGDRIYDVYCIEEEAKAISSSVAGNHGIAPLYRSPVCPYITGNVTRYCTLTPFTLTDAEREAIEGAILEMDGIMQEFIPTPVYTRLRRQVSTLRGLLERTK
jgi:hypothetical protein